MYGTLDNFLTEIGLQPIPDQDIWQSTLINGLKVSERSLSIYAECRALSHESELLAEKTAFLENSLERYLKIPEALVFYNRENDINKQTASNWFPWFLRHVEKSNAFGARLLANGFFQECTDEGISLFVPLAPERLKNSATITAFKRLWHDMFPQSKLTVLSAAGAVEGGTVKEPEWRNSILDQIVCSVPSPEERERSVPPVSTFDRGGGKFKKSYRSRKSDRVIWGKTGEPIELSALNDIDEKSCRVMVRGTVIDHEVIATRSENHLLKFILADNKGSLLCKLFMKPEPMKELIDRIDGAYIQVTAMVQFDGQFDHDFVGTVKCIETADAPPERVDKARRKRVELHIHSKMSSQDATSDPGKIVERAAGFGHPAIALTDHGVVQGFPEAANTVRKFNAAGNPIKLLYGVEGYLLDEYDDPIVYNIDEDFAPDRVCALCVSENGDLGIADYIIFSLNDRNGEKTVSGRIEYPVSAAVHSAEKLAEFFALSEQLKAVPVVTPDGIDTLNRLRVQGFKIPGTDPRIKFNPILIDLKKWLSVTDESSSLKETASSADAVMALTKRLWAAFDGETLAGLNGLTEWKDFAALKRERRRTNHIVLLAANYLGLYHLYRLISASHLQYFYYRPRIPRSVLRYFSGGLSIGAACVAGEVFSGVLQHYHDCDSDYKAAAASLTRSRLPAIAKFYDYLEIQPLCNNDFLLEEVDSGVRSKEDLQNLNKLVIELGRIADRPVCATCDSHFLDPEDGIYRRILLSDMEFKDAESSADLFFRTTDEMLAEFSYLGTELAEEVVVDNTQKIASRIEPGMLPFPDGSFPPIIQSAADDITRSTWEKAEALYGYNGEIPDIVKTRIERELDAIIRNGFAIMYYIAQAVVKKSNDDGYPVGSRGSVGSSLVATLSGITEVNPLMPHYLCPRCRYSEFDDSGKYGSGFDLPEKHCPHCGTLMKREGHDIPFETFLGFNGDKQPDIDLNFSGFYQPRAHAFIEEMFGIDYTFRAGTIGSYAEKNSAAMVNTYFEKNELVPRRSEINRIAKGLIGVKRTTGQHPGGIVVVPKEREIYDFTPIQYPANKSDSGIITTHFDFNAMHDTILKLDILGHDDPSMLKMLGDLTGVDIYSIPIPDPKVMDLFAGTDSLGIPTEASAIGSGTIGLPELGTKMAREMIAETHPTKFYDLIQISGLSHGTDVWKGNAQDLIRNGTCTIDEVIGCRDSIMTSLIYAGLPPKASFDIMEKVRKGKGLSEEHEQLMRDHSVPDWYIESCKKIKYMFPKAHAVAYIMSAMRIAYFKVYYPEAYYCAFFTIRATDFKSDYLMGTPDQIRIRRKQEDRRYLDMTKDEQKKFLYLELVEEMMDRGIEFLPVSLQESHAIDFYYPEKNKIRPPLNVIPGISDNIALSIVKAREDGEFRTVEELCLRSGIGRSCIENLRQEGVLDHLPESAQVDLFSLLDNAM